MMDRIRLGMILFIVSESVFFLLLILAYAFYHGEGTGPSAASSLNPVRTGLFSVALLSSSLTMWGADVAAKQGRRRWAKAALLATVALGATFLAGQLSEYAHLLRENVSVSRNLFGTTFFTLTGFHGFHVFVGLIMIAILAGLALATDGREPPAKATQVVGLYWHFVDGVWVVIFAVVYLWGVW